jgi:hypothetical protein
VRHEIVPIWAAALLGSLVPIAVILICQIRIRSFWDTSNAIIGLLYSLITAAVFQVRVSLLFLEDSQGSESGSFRELANEIALIRRNECESFRDLSKYPDSNSA